MAFRRKFSRAWRRSRIIESHLADFDATGWKRQKKITALLAASIAVALVIAGLFIYVRPTRTVTNTLAGNASPLVSVIPEKSIAVLPFENLSDDKENAFFADGVQDEILTDLAKVADLKVISRTSVMQYRNAAARNLRQIGQQLGVSHVLEGSVQCAANKIRVNAQLIDARNDAHLWAHTYDRDLADVFAIQSEIAETIAGQLQARLSPSEKAAIAEAPTKDVVANDLYVRARALDDLANDPGAKEYLLQGVSLLEEAVRRDPNFLLAYCLMCETHLDLYWYGFDHTTARRDQARRCVCRRPSAFSRTPAKCTCTRVSTPKTAFAIMRRRAQSLSSLVAPCRIHRGSIFTSARSIVARDAGMIPLGISIARSSWIRGILWWWRKLPSLMGD